MIIAQSALEAILTKENVHQTAYIITVIMFIYLFIYQLFWTQASPEGMCMNGTQVPCDVPSLLPNTTTRKGWPHHRSLRPLLFSKSDVGSSYRSVSTRGHLNQRECPPNCIHNYGYNVYLFIYLPAFLDTGQPRGNVHERDSGPMRRAIPTTQYHNP